MTTEEMIIGLEAHIGHEHQQYSSNWYQTIVAKLRAAEEIVKASENGASPAVIHTKIIAYKRAGKEQV